ncbi:MAG: DUF3084 domain-containing protein [Cytophagales bacterium]|nr:DUF3084 domain-containing protein [Armatimonadota bacterium]
MRPPVSFASALFGGADRESEAQVKIVTSVGPRYVRNGPLSSQSLLRCFPPLAEDTARAMNVALLFFLLLVPVSGFIAWAGDRIGHKSGKKRHTLFGLRPRHTATLITIAAGMSISVVSFGIMWAVSGTFREVVARGAELLHENKRLSRNNKDALKQVAEKLTRIESLDTQVRDYQTQAAAAALGKRDAEVDYRKARQALVTARQTLIIAGRDLAMTRTRLGATQGKLDTAQRQVGDARQQVARANRDFQQAEARRSEAQTAARRAEAQVAVAETKASQAQARLGKATSGFQAATQFQKEKLSERNAQISTQDELLRTQTARINEQQAELGRLTEEMKRRRQDLDAIVTEFRTTTTALRGRQITYQVGEEVDRVSIPAGISIWRIESILDSLLTSAAKKAEVRGAKRVMESSRAVALLPQPAMVSLGLSPDRSRFGPLPLNPAGLRGPNPATDNSASSASVPVLPAIAESDLIRAAADAIRRGNKEVVVVVVTSANAVADEPVAVDLRTFRNPIVLTSGTTVGEITVDGSASRQEIVDALYGFLRRDVRTRLLKAGVIPPLVGGDGAGSAGGASSGALPEAEAGNIFALSGDAWLKIMDDIRRAGSQARVTVRVDRTTRAADPVSLRFDVKRGRDSRPAPRAPEGDPSGGGSRGGNATNGMAVR